MASLALEKGSTVLVTGANGFVASHICDQTLAVGYNVKGTVRSSAKGAWMLEMFDKKYGPGRFSVAVVEDMTSDGAFDVAMQGCDGLIHAASNLSFSPDANEVIPQTVAGALSALKTAAKTPSVRRVVYMSSGWAIAMPKPDTPLELEADMWDESALQTAWAPPPYTRERGPTVYTASKLEAERACWKFVKDEKPQFVLNTTCADMHMGEILHKEQPASTAGMVRSLWNNEPFGLKMMTNVTQHHIDVKDSARLLIAALIYADVKNERLLGYAEPINLNKILATMRKLDPQRILPEDAERPVHQLYTANTERSVELLKRLGRPRWTCLEDSVRENCLGTQKPSSL